MKIEGSLERGHAPNRHTKLLNHPQTGEDIEGNKNPTIYSNSHRKKSSTLSTFEHLMTVMILRKCYDKKEEKNLVIFK